MSDSKQKRIVELEAEVVRLQGIIAAQNLQAACLNERIAWLTGVVEAGATRSSSLPSASGIEIVSPADHEPEGACSCCGQKFKPDDEAIPTLHVRYGKVTLCRECYDAAGSDVR